MNGCVEDIHSPEVVAEGSEHRRWDLICMASMGDSQLDGLTLTRSLCVTLCD